MNVKQISRLKGLVAHYHSTKGDGGYDILLLLAEDGILMRHDFPGVDSVLDLILQVSGRFLIIGDLRRLSPHIVVHIDGDVLNLGD